MYTGRENVKQSGCFTMQNYLLVTSYTKFVYYPLCSALLLWLLAICDCSVPVWWMFQLGNIIGHRRLHAHCTQRQHVWHCTFRYVSSYLNCPDGSVYNYRVRNQATRPVVCASHYYCLGHINTLCQTSNCTGSSPSRNKWTWLWWPAVNILTQSQPRRLYSSTYAVTKDAHIYRFIYLQWYCLH